MRGVWRSLIGQWMSDCDWLRDNDDEDVGSNKQLKPDYTLRGDRLKNRLKVVRKIVPYWREVTIVKRVKLLCLKWPFNSANGYLCRMKTIKKYVGYSGIILLRGFNSR